MKKLSGHLTDKQSVVLNWISRLTKEKGYPPTTRELAEKLGMFQTGAVGHINALIRKGRLTKEPRLARSLRVV